MPADKSYRETSAGIIFLLNVVYIKINNRIGLKEEFSLET